MSVMRDSASVIRDGHVDEWETNVSVCFQEYSLDRTYMSLPFYLLILGALLVIVILLSHFASWKKKIRAPPYYPFTVVFEQRRV